MIFEINNWRTKNNDISFRRINADRRKYLLMYLLFAWLICIKCASTYGGSSGVPMVFAYICVENEYNKIIVMNNDPIYSKFIVERIDSLGNVLFEKELIPGPTKMSGKGAVWDDIGSCSENIFYRVFAVNSSTGEKILTKVTHATNKDSKK